MFETGNLLLDLLSGITLLFPLLPVVFAFIKSQQGAHEAFPLLIVVCLLAFLKNIFLSGILPLQSGIQFFTLLISLFQFICLVLVFRIRYTMQMRTIALLILVASISILLTCYLLKGFDTFANAGLMIICGLIVVYSLTTLVNFFLTEDLYLPGEPGFWIAAGSFFFWGMLLMIIALKEMNYFRSKEGEHEIVFLYNLSSCIQFSLFCCAVLFFSPKNIQKEEN